MCDINESDRHLQCQFLRVLPFGVLVLRVLVFEELVFKALVFVVLVFGVEVRGPASMFQTMPHFDSVFILLCLALLCFVLFHVLVLCCCCFYFWFHVLFCVAVIYLLIYLLVLFAFLFMNFFAIKKRSFKQMVQNTMTKDCIQSNFRRFVAKKWCVIYL